MRFERVFRRRNLVQDARHHGVGGHRLGQGFVSQHHAMAQDVSRQVLDVLGQDVAAAAQEGQRACAFDQVDGGARAGAVFDEARISAMPCFSGQRVADTSLTAYWIIDGSTYTCRHSSCKACNCSVLATAFTSIAGPVTRSTMMNSS